MEEKRLQILDDLLRHGEYSTTQLMNRVNDRLAAENLHEVNSLNTIRHDLMEIEARLGIDLQRKSGRNRYYAYPDKTMSIYNTTFKQSEFETLVQCMAMLSNIEGMKWVTEFLDRAELTVKTKIDGRPIIGLDQCPYLKNIDYLPTLRSAIEGKQPLVLSYKSFKSDEPKKIIVHPYYLKQYNKRWFLVGKDDVHNIEPDDFAVYPFDRILKIEDCKDVEYREIGAYNFEEDYFDDMIGVTRHQGDELQEVCLRVSPSTLQYITTKPLHSSQKIDRENNIIKIEVIPNYELKQNILYYGKEIEVISPVSLREEMKQIYQEALKQYK